jgi:uncharacterized protein (TIGR02147 family)
MLMTCVFNFTDFRVYLKAYYAEKKAENPSFSYQVMAERGGFKDKSTIYGVIQNRRNLSQKSAFKLSRVLKHNRYEAEYFQSLVGFNQAADLKEQNYYFEKMQQVKGYGKGYSGARQLRKEQFEYFSKWHNTVIKALINLYGFKGDYKWLASSLRPPILPKQAKKAVELLEKLGIIAKGSNGSYHVVDKALTTGKEVVSLAVLNFHAQMAQLALNAMRELPKEKRFLNGLTLGISKETYDIICCKIEKFASEILELAVKDDKADRVFQLNFQLFPISQVKESAR